MLGWENCWKSSRLFRQTYGYRRMWLWLGNQGIRRDLKTVLRVMKKCNALAGKFFPIFKTKCIYRQKIAAGQQDRYLIEEFVCFYNHERFRLKIGIVPHKTQYSLSRVSFLCCPYNLRRFKMSGLFYFNVCLIRWGSTVGNNVKSVLYKINCNEICRINFCRYSVCKNIKKYWHLKK